MWSLSESLKAIFAEAWFSVQGTVTRLYLCHSRHIANNSVTRLVQYQCLQIGKFSKEPHRIHENVKYCLTSNRYRNALHWFPLTCHLKVTDVKEICSCYFSSILVLLVFVNFSNDADVNDSVWRCMWSYKHYLSIWFHIFILNFLSSSEIKPAEKSSGLRGNDSSYQSWRALGTGLPIYRWLLFTD